MGGLSTEVAVEGKLDSATVKAMTLLPPALVPAEPETAVELPHATWGEEWRPLLSRFANAATLMKPVQRMTFEPLPLGMRVARTWRKLRAADDVDLRKSGFYLLYTWNVPVKAIRDRGLRREMMSFAEALYHYELPPEQAVILTRLFDGPGRDRFLHLIGWLRAALVELTGKSLSAVAPPTGGSGSEGDNAMEPHSDMWIPALLFNAYNEVVPGQGATTIMPLARMWDVAAEIGVPDNVREQLRDALVEAGECDYYMQFNGLLYNDHPWSKTAEAAMTAAATHVALQPGQGYFVNDREWLHGRTALDRAALPEDRREHRLYRLVYNNARLEASARERRREWELIGRTAAGCKL